MMINRRFLKLNSNYIIIAVALVLLGCNRKEDIVFKEIPDTETGITFVNQITETDDLSILDYLYFYNGGGVAIGDINNDGLPDIFFSGNQVKNKLYLNKGNFKFEDISDKAGIRGNSTWNTGAIMGDVNGDGFLDIYVCAVVGINGFGGYNELYINNGDETFTESATKYALDYASFSSSAAFLDYDLDGDLDIYLLNHAVHTQESFGHANLRYRRNYQTGDKLLRNDNGIFTDVSEQSGIFGGPNGYGLGLAISDFNQDGYPDIYVGNDFHEDDYYYINNGDGTFTDKLKMHFGHTTRFSMGNDVADINHDGLPDLLTLDMHAEDEKVLKSSEGDEDYQIQKLRLKQYGYYYQFVRNMMQVNQSNGNFKETALLSGIASTDWSWSALFGDFNQDGEQDIYISNGILKRPNDLDYINYVSNEQIVKKIEKTSLVDKQALSMMPSGKVNNYIFEGKGNLLFENKSTSWLNKNVPTVSNATAMGDLDNDGDLDLVVTNLNELPTILQNQTNNKATYLKLKFNYDKPNTFGVGTKVYAYNKGTIQFKELYTCRGFQASSEPMIHFGFKNAKTIDSIKIVWPNYTYQIEKNIATNQTLVLKPKNTKIFVNHTDNTKKLFQKVDNNLGINFHHEEDNYTDFIRQKLIPYQVSNKGPAVAVGDLNNDGKADIFFGGSKFKSSKIYLQQDSTYIAHKFFGIVKDSIKEDISAVISDFNNDKKNDLFIGTGGADFYNKAKPLQDSYYIQQDSTFVNHKLPDYYENASVVRPYDFDDDGDLDIFIGNYTVTNDFGKTPPSFLLVNTDGNFEIKDSKVFENIGMVTDAVWDDFDNDGIKDLIVVGEWMSPKFYKNNNGSFTEVVKTDNLNGLWQAIQPFDIDGDGDTDYLLGNWGLNTKFKASEKFPLQMYYADFDDNGKTETIVCVEKNKEYYPLLGLNELANQLLFLKKKYTTYKAFAGQPITAILENNMLEKAKILKVYNLSSGYLRNDNGDFKFIPFETELQLAPITSFLKFDFNKDNKEEVLVGGNYFGVAPFHGRFDAFSGALIKDANTLLLAAELGIDFSKKEVKNLNIIYIKNKPYVLVTMNNDDAEVYKISN